MTWTPLALTSWRTTSFREDHGCDRLGAGEQAAGVVSRDPRAVAVSCSVLAVLGGGDDAPITLGAHEVVFDSDCHAEPHLGW
jgi:hypothetical protein